MHDPGAEKFRITLEEVRQEIVAAIHAWHERGGSDAELALVVDALHPGKPTVSAMTRDQLKLTIPDFDPTIVIQFTKHTPGKVPAVVEVRDYVRRIMWIDLTPPYTW